MAVGLERPRWADYEDFMEDVDDIGNGGFKDGTIGCREGLRQPRNRRDFMYFDVVLWQKKMMWTSPETPAKTDYMFQMVQ
jgi:hypothetical protein